MLLHVSVILLFLVEYSIVWTHHSLFLHLPSDRHLGSFHLGAFKNEVGMDIWVRVFVSTYAFISLQ